MNIGYTAFKLGYTLSPIILTDGIASAIPGGMLPIIAITEAANFVGGLLQGNIDADLDQYFAHYVLPAGNTIINQQIGKYPFANQSVAANAVIQQPLQVSLQMICPAQGSGGWAKKLVTMIALKKALDKHNASGGTYTIATPAYIYTNCVMLGMRDISGGDDKQPQHTFQLDFEQPLLALADAHTVYNSLLNKLANGLPIDGQPTWTGLATTTISSTVTGLGNSLVTGAKNLIGTAVSNVKYGS